MAVCYYWNDGVKILLPMDNSQAEEYGWYKICMRHRYDGTFKFRYTLPDEMLSWCEQHTPRSFFIGDLALWFRTEEERTMFLLVFGN